MSVIEIILGYVEDNVKFQLKKVNWYGFIVGVIGIGKMVILQMLVEEFFQQGVLVFLVDVKGDLLGVSQVGFLYFKIIE